MRFVDNIYISLKTRFSIFFIVHLLQIFNCVSGYEESKYIDNFNIPLFYDIPDSNSSTEIGGARAEIKVFDTRSQKYLKYTVLLDSHSSAFWLISSFCVSPDCNPKQKVFPNSNLGSCELYYNKGVVLGSVDTKTVHLNSIVLEQQPVFLINQLDFPEFRDSILDGVLGISKVFSPLHHKAPFSSILQTAELYIKQDHISAKVVLILKLGGLRPYMKLYFMEDFDYYHVREDAWGRKETVFWLHLFDKGKLMFALRSIKLKYYAPDPSVNSDKSKIENDETERTGKDINKRTGLRVLREEVVLKDCEETGCRALLDTKSYFIYGPADQIAPLKQLRGKCPGVGSEAGAGEQEDVFGLPDIEFSFYDVDPGSSSADSSVELTLQPKDYMVKAGDEDGGEDCVVGVKDHKTDYGWNFGILFLRPFMVMYDFKEDMVGFVRVHIEDE